MASVYIEALSAINSTRWYNNNFILTAHLLDTSLQQTPSIGVMISVLALMWEIVCSQPGCVKSMASEWLLFNANSAIFQLYHGENKLIINEMMIRFVLYFTNKLSWIFIVLDHRNSLRIDMSPHSDTFSWFLVNQSLLFLLNAAC